MDRPQPQISQLESAIRQLDSVKKHLYYTSSQIKTQIHSSISRHLEALRNREVWLLSQVDLVLSAKEEILQTQQARLNKTFGILQSSLALAEDGDGLDSRLVDKFSILDLTDLKPEETPYLSFCADQVGLREAILNYGRVDANGIPLQTAFIDQEISSTCMPGHFEDYEDADHHVFYKTVEEINRSRRPSGSIRVNFPKLSTRAEDWLYQPPGCKTVSTATIPKFSFPAFSRNPQDWIPSGSGKEASPRMYGDSCIQNWLSQIQQSPAFEEEDDFEIVGNSVEERTPPVVDKPAFKPFQSMTKKTWLKSSHTNRSSAQWDDEVHGWFAHVPSDTEIWLAKGRKKMEQKAGRAESNSLSKTNNDYPNIMDAFFKELPKTWLKGENAKSKWTWTNRFKTDRTSMGNEGGISKPYAGDNSVWLKSNAKNVANQQLDPSFVSFFKPLQLEKKKWVNTVVDEIKNDQFKHDFKFFDTLSTNHSDWLKQLQSGMNKNIPGIARSFQFDKSNLDENEWLKFGDFQCESAPIPEFHTWKVVENMHKKMSQDEWVLKQHPVEIDADHKIGEEIFHFDDWNLFSGSNHGNEVGPKEMKASSVGHWLL